MAQELHIAHEHTLALAKAYDWVSNSKESMLDTAGDLEVLLDYMAKVMGEVGLKGTWGLAQAGAGHYVSVKPGDLPKVETHVGRKETLRDLLGAALADLLAQSIDQWSAPATTLA